MTNKLFFGNLDWTTDKDEVHDHFSPFGEIVEISIAVDKESGRNRGFGFVTYEREESAKDAIQNLDGSEFKGRKLGVKAAEANKERTSR
ncbi:RNP-1 like RNA-binding protein [Conidiobolus coronatus NRRL 28638]|uniref:RNP-1 like RNA-binding protein n=1 Tax=Conidiobolus coronatus (strain ATCC 28846 / CBS 209.66 / NRRL 28638) TaxID=796925 RepID=A0A137PCQ5_CONC2|nr:RNP-1 like RNA-binding protein [Conidiobolus coronatus NRRL 28638]|eukprot:KXN72788.1 RNP-1 like RNA-binding protein [Conidiobolus coronatus NRRL 28638]